MKTQINHTSIRLIAALGLCWIASCDVLPCQAVALDSIGHGSRASEHSANASYETLASVATVGASVIEAGACAFAVPVYLSGAVAYSSAVALTEISDTARNARMSEHKARGHYSQDFNTHRLAAEINRTK